MKLSCYFLKYYFYVSLLLFIFGAGNYCYLSAQPNALFFQPFTNNQGLSEPTNAFSYRCSRGFLWTSSLDGLNRFDGKNTRTYQPFVIVGDSSSIDPNIQSNLFEDSNGDLWFTVGEGIIKYDRERDTLLYNPVIHPTNAQKISGLYAFHLDEEKNLWLVGNNQFLLYNIISKKIIELRKTNAVRAYPILDKKGKTIGIASTVFGGQGAGIQIFEFQAGKLSPPVSFFNNNNTHSQPATRIFHFLIENDTSIWLPAHMGLIHFNPQTLAFQLYDHFKNKPIENLVDVMSWRENYLWIASSSQGLYLFDKKRQQFIGQDTMIWLNNEMIDFRRINNLYIDKEDNLWCSIWGKGIYFANLQNSKFTHQLPADTYTLPSPRNVTAITQDASGRVWCGVSGEGVFQFKSQNQNNTNILNPQFDTKIPVPDRIRSILCDRHGTIWLITTDSIETYSQEEGVFQKIGGNFNNLRKIIQVADNRWVVLAFTDLIEINRKDNQFEFDTIQLPQLPESVLGNLFHASDGHLYLSYSTDGMARLSYNKGKWEKTKEIRGIGYLTSLIQDEKHAHLLWATSDRGLLKIDKTTWNKTFIKDTSRLLVRSFNSVLQDNNGDLWLSSNAGIFQWKPDTKTAIQYTKSDGLQGMEFLPGSCLKASDGSLWFGGANGVNTIYPDAVKKISVQPRTQIIDIQVNGQPFPFEKYVGELEGYTFKHEENTLTFDFVALEFSDAANNQFEFRLKNFEKDWVKAGTRGFARYPNLPPGNYILQIKAANSDGVWTENLKEFKIKILPPWWQTWWARTLGVLLALGVIYGIYRFRINQIKKKEEFRRKEAEYKQQVAEIETAVLRLQMNPHFIFNSMNSISSYILQKNIDTANDYLARFAKLMRMILKFAEKPFITVGEEIDLLEQYLQTEAMRLDKKFTYQFDIAPDLDPDEVILPTMILQPFAENAIWHGLSPKVGEGRIDIRFWIENNLLFCSIQDDGIGRVAAAKKSSKAHESKALSLTERRLKLLKNADGAESSFEIIDLYDANGAATGTKVLLKLPLL